MSKVSSDFCVRTTSISRLQLRPTKPHSRTAMNSEITCSIANSVKAASVPFALARRTRPTSRDVAVKVLHEKHSNDKRFLCRALQT